MQISCPSCKNPVMFEDINHKKRIAKCASCHEVFRFSEDDLTTTNSSHKANELDTPDAQETKEESHTKAPPRSADSSQEPALFALPSGVTLQRDEQQLRIHWRWYTPVAYLMVFIGIAWNVSLLSMIWKTFSGDFIAEVVPCFFLVFGFGLIYAGIVFLVNETTISVQHKTLSIRHTPLPWSGNRTFSVDDLEQFFCKQHICRKKRETSVGYGLYAISRNGKQIEILNGIEDPEKVWFIERILEEHLGIADQRVFGEYKG